MKNNIAMKPIESVKTYEYSNPRPAATGRHQPQRPGENPR